MSQQLSSRVVINVGDRLRRSINAQLEYLDCFEDLLNTLPIANIPDNLLDAMSFVGSTLSFIQGFEGTQQVKELFRSFNPIAVIVTQMRNEIEDALFELKEEHGIELSFDDIDKIMDECIDIAKARYPTK